MRASCIWLLFSVIFFVSCEEEEIPSFIYIEDIKVNDRNGISATTEKITDAWVYINEDFRGIYQLPATIPHLGEGDFRLSVSAGIKKNGIAKSRDSYPFMQPYEATITLTRDQTLEVFPEVNYADNLVYAIEESFEDVNLTFTRDTSSNAYLERGQDPAILQTGNFYGEILLNANDTNQFYTGITNPLTLPQGGRPVWLEIDFANDTEIEVGITPNFPDGRVEYVPLLFLNPTFSESPVIWNKVYIDLTESVSSLSYATSFQIVLTTQIEDNASQGQVYFDNINVIHREF